MSFGRLSRALGFGLLILFACKANDGVATSAEQQSTLSSMLLGRTPTGISLSALPLRDTFALAGPVEVAYVIRNGVQRRSFRNDPLFFYFDLIAPDGRPMTVVAGPEPGSLGAVPDLVLPADGILGRVIDLACARPAFSTQPPGQGQCAWKYAFTEPGRYRLVARYQPPAAPAERTEGSAQLQLQSDTIGFVITR